MLSCPAARSDDSIDPPRCGDEILGRDESSRSAIKLSLGNPPEIRTFRVACYSDLLSISVKSRSENYHKVLTKRP